MRCEGGQPQSGHDDHEQRRVDGLGAHGGPALDLGEKRRYGRIRCEARRLAPVHLHEERFEEIRRRADRVPGRPRLGVDLALHLVDALRPWRLAGFTIAPMW